MRSFISEKSKKSADVDQEELFVKRTKRGSGPARRIEWKKKSHVSSVGHTVVQSWYGGRS